MEKKINRAIVVTMLCAVLFAGIAFLFRNSPYETAASADKTFDMCEYIEVDLLRLNVEIAPYDGDEIRICYKNDLPLEIKHGDNRLTISESDRFVVSLFPGAGVEFGLEIYLPEKSYREISVSNGSGSVDIGRIDSRKLVVSTESGNIFCRDTVSQCNIATEEGYISADFETVIDGCEIQSRKGNAEIFIPEKSSVAVDFETEKGECETDLYIGEVHGSYKYSWSGGDNCIHAIVQQGKLTISEREK